MLPGARSLVLTALLAAVLCAGCGSRPRPIRASIPPARIRPLEARIDAVPGRTLVIPVALEGAIDSRRPLGAHLDDGRRLAAAIHWISVSPTTSGAPAGGWLASPGAWSVTPLAASTLPSGAGGWVISVDLPLDCIGQGFWVSDQRIPLNWLGDPGAGRAVPWRSIDEAARWPQLLRLVEPEALSPVRRWRYRLLTLGPQGLAWGWEGEPPPAMAGRRDEPFAHPVLEAMARQDEARWAAALTALWTADADLAERVRRRLVAVVEFAGGVLAPAWPTNMEGLRAVRDELLNPRLDRAARIERAQAWLDALPPAAAWVADDAGARAPGGEPEATLGVANLTERATLAWVASPGASTPPELIPLPSLESRLLAASAPPPEPAGRTERFPRPARFEVHAGRWMGERAAVVRALPVAPPGLAAGPLVADWTMETWLSGEPSAALAVEPAWACAAVLSERAENAEAGGPRWWFYIECKSPGGAGAGGRSPASEESVRVWLGPREHPVAVLRVSSGGAVVDERAMERTGDGAVAGATVSRLADRWVCWLPVPAAALDDQGTIRIGLERTDARGRRSAWPRPMLPWQPEPARALADTRVWGAVEAAGR